jgi:hypothetical protein
VLLIFIDGSATTIFFSRPPSATPPREQNDLNLPIILLPLRCYFLGDPEIRVM